MSNLKKKEHYPNRIMFRCTDLDLSCLDGIAYSKNMKRSKLLREIVQDFLKKHQEEMLSDIVVDELITINNTRN